MEQSIIQRLSVLSCGPHAAGADFTFVRFMARAAAITPPWGSKGLLNRAGEKIRRGDGLSWEELSAFEDWRAAHSYVLNTFKPLLWSRVRGKRIVVAQRLKRRSTIIDKLAREPKMALARMDDIAGCRLIFENIAALEAFRGSFHASKFNHTLKHDDVNKYNYINSPKPSGSNLTLGAHV
jgi:putative GTP pyrophosphokinase